MASSASPLFQLIVMLIVAALALVHPAASHRPLIGACHASGYLPGKSGHCDPGYDSDCCQPGKSYPQYRCSPPVSGNTRAQLTVNCFEENCDGGAPSECDGQYHSDKDLVVALSTGWYNGGSRCHKMIRINGNGRSVVAKVVDECDSVNGCDDDHDFQPPCPNNVVDGSPAVWAALGIDTDVGVYDITWSDDDVINPHVGIDSQRRPHRRRTVHHVVGAGRLEVVIVVAPIHRVALVHHLRHHAPPVPVDPDHLVAAPAAVVPPRRQRHHHVLVAVVLAVALRRGAAIAVLLEAVDGQLSAGIAGDGRRAAILRVGFARLAAVGVVAWVAVAGLSWEVAAGVAGSDERAVGGSRMDDAHQGYNDQHDNELKQRRSRRSHCSKRQTAMASSDSPLFQLIAMLLVAALVLVVHPAASHRPLIGACNPSGYLPGKSGHCDPGFDSDCCQPGKSYPQYRCSPPVSGNTRAQLTVNCFQENCDGGAPSECDGQYHSDKDLVVALSTGWYHGGSRCHKMIRINGNGRSVVAKVVDECDSVNGCDDEHDFQPPCPNNVVDGSPAVWAALGIDTDVGVYDITWSDE
ncbi:uncharacterized protein LOC141829782 [Curcuma longa]|uniref:uncharacterized protein LOC141829782 n=1 Tax=Curcuma longa TaxID=136217 RepID=UPI003D9F1957